MKKISIPFWVYIVLITLSLLLVFSGLFHTITCINVFEILCNIGYGLLGSTLVAFFIDLANAKKKSSHDLEILRILSAEYRSAFLDLRDCVISVAETRYGTDGQKRTFNEWIDYIFAPAREDETPEDIEENAFDVLFQIEKIQKTAIRLHELLLLNLDNSENTKEYRQSVKTVCSLSSHICDEIESSCYVNAIKNIKERLIPKFLGFNPDNQNYFTEPYCENRYEE